jgi:hypothetical protein
MSDGELTELEKKAMETWRKKKRIVRGITITDLALHIYGKYETYRIRKIAADLGIRLYRRGERSYYPLSSDDAKRIIQAARRVQGAKYLSKINSGANRRR